MNLRRISTRDICAAALSLIFIYHGLVPKLIFIDTSGELDLVKTIGFIGDNEKTLLMITGVFEIIFGIAIFVWRKKDWPFVLTIVAMIALGIGGVIQDHDALIKPYNPLTFNAALTVLAYVAITSHAKEKQL